jgi:hypothetical protein
MEGSFCAPLHEASEVERLLAGSHNIRIRRFRDNWSMADRQVCRIEAIKLISAERFLRTAGWTGSACISAFTE